MRLLFAAAVIALLSIASGCSGGSVQHTGSIATNAAGRYIVGLNPGESVSALSGPLSHVPDHAYSHVLNGFAGYLTANEVDSLSADPRVSFVEPDLTVEALVPPGGGGGGGGGGGQALPWGVNRIDAELNANWAGHTAGAGVAVAVFDTGVNVSHPDLAGAIIATYNATGSGSVEDQNGHGTHCSGIIGARNNSIGYVGVAPDCKLVAVKVLGNSGSGQISWIVAGIDWAVAHRNDNPSYPIRVGSMSLGAQGSSSALATAITNAAAAGIIFAVASGNSAANASSFIPASYSNVITVSALDPDNTWAYYSNYGSAVDLIAPGTDVPSLWKGGGYKTISGTSMATPHVAGCVALWLDNNYDGDALNDHADDFASVKSALQAAGTTTWTGDPSDGYHEPLVYAASL